MRTYVVLEGLPGGGAQVVAVVPGVLDGRAAVERTRLRLERTYPGEGPWALEAEVVEPGSVRFVV